MSVVTLKAQLEKVQNLLISVLQADIPEDLKTEIENSIQEISFEYHANHGVTIRQSRIPGMCIELECPTGQSVNLKSSGEIEDEAKLLSKIVQILVANSTISARFSQNPSTITDDKKMRSMFNTIASPTQQQVDNLDAVINSRGQITKHYSKKGKEMLPKLTREELEDI